MKLKDGNWSSKDENFSSMDENFSSFKIEGWKFFILQKPKDGIMCNFHPSLSSMDGKEGWSWRMTDMDIANKRNSCTSYLNSEVGSVAS